LKNPFKRKTSEGSASHEPSILQTRWFGSLLSFCVLLLIVAGLVQFYAKAERYAGQTIKNKFSAEDAALQPKIPLLCELKNQPSWLDKTILDQIFNETQEFAARDQVTYDRLQNPLDQDILREIAENYTGTDSKGVNHWALRNNAWIRKIVEVRRVIAKDKKSQTIEIYAEYRQPAAWVIYNDKCYLVDGALVRLPGEYSQADRRASGQLMAITGVQLPAGSTSVPEPSATWNTPDLAAGLQMVQFLHAQRFVSQIDAVNMANFQGRKDSRQPWIVLDTIWPTSADPSKPRVVQWGRPVGEESFYDVSAKAKLKSLNQLFMQYHRIDANRDFVDIHTEQIWIPKTAAAGDDSAARPRG
jgi:hypothetical protein